MHVNEFGVWPPGQFQGSYVDSKKMNEMRKFLEEIGAAEDPTPTAEKKATTPARLAALRQRLFAAREGGAGSVSFATPPGEPSILQRKKASDALTRKLEKPTHTISSESEAEVAKVKKTGRTSKEPSISAALYAAVEKRQNQAKSSARSPSPDVKATKDKKKKKKKNQVVHHQLRAQAKAAQTA